MGTQHVRSETIPESNYLGQNISSLEKKHTHIRWGNNQIPKQTRHNKK